VADIFDGATVLFGGFGGAGEPQELFAALLRQGKKNLLGVSDSIGKVSPATRKTATLTPICWRPPTGPCTRPSSRARTESPKPDFSAA